MKMEKRYLFMEITPKRKAELEKLVSKFCREKDINMTQDIVEQLNKQGFLIRKTQFNKPLDGMILVDESSDRIDKYKANKVIFYDANKSLKEARFIIAHEFAHYISKKINSSEENILVAKRDHSVGNYSNNEREQEMDYMAAVMLLPSADLESQIQDFLQKSFNEILLDDTEKRKIKLNTYFIEKIAEDYRVEEKLVKRRLDELFDPINVEERKAL